MEFSKIALALGFGSMMLVAAGCGPSKALEAAQEYEKNTCACKDAACVADAAKKYAARASDAATAKSSETDAITKATTAATECATKIATAGIPGMPAIPGKH
jgi:hypothetical protein